MVSTFHSLETGKRGLQVGQASIATTGHNIANANTKGYSRQQVNQTASPSLNVWTNGSVNPGQLGSGVSLDSITRVRDRFLDNQFRDQSSTLGESQTRQATFDRLETVINEPSDTGLNAAMDKLAGAWQDLANDPDSASAQAVVKQRAQEFVEVAQSMNQSLDNMKTDLSAQKSAAINDANGYLEKISELNTSIVRNGSQSNDLLDQRDALVEELAKLVQIKVEPQSNGAYHISRVSPTEDKPKATTSLLDAGGVKPIKQDEVVTGGKIGGLIEAESNRNKLQGKLEDVVISFAEMVNANTKLAPNTAPDPNNPLDSLFNVPGETGGNEPNKIARLTVNFEANNLGVPAEEFSEKFQEVKKPFQELVSELGAQSQSAVRSVANFEATLQATENRRQSVSGVSLDEEMANLVKFQHAYSAAARLISTTDEMLDTIINRMAP